MRVVVDTNVLARALTRPGGAARECLRLLMNEPHRVVLSVPLLAELDEVLAYPRLLARSQVTAEDAREFLAALIEVSEVYEILAPLERPVSSDPDDDIVIQTALHGRAEVICTKDRHLRSDVVRAFLAAHGIRVLDDAEFLRELRGGASGPGG